MVVDSLTQKEVMAMVRSMEAERREEGMTFALLLHIFMVDMSLVVLITHVGGLLKVILALVNQVIR